MPVFWYKAVDSTGHHQKGMVCCADVAALGQLLEQRRLCLIRAHIYRQPLLGSLSIQKNALQKALCDFFTQLDHLLQQKALFVDAFQVLLTIMDYKPLLAVLYQVQADMQRGLTFSGALQAHAETADPFIIQTLFHAEQTGSLNNACHIISQYLHRKLATRSLRRKTLFYPCCVLGMTFLLLWGSLYYLVPVIRESMPQSLPQNQRLLFALADFCQSPLGLLYLILGAGSMVLLCFFLPFFRTQRRIRKEKIAWIQWLQNLAFALKSGVPLKDALSYPAAPILKQPLYLLISALSDGQTFHAALESIRSIPRSTVPFVRLGEATGCLSEMLEKSAQMEQNRMLQSQENFWRYLQPALLVFSGLLLLWIITATILPLYQMFPV